MRPDDCLLEAPISSHSLMDLSSEKICRSTQPFGQVIAFSVAVLSHMSNPMSIVF